MISIIDNQKKDALYNRTFLNIKKEPISQTPEHFWITDAFRHMKCENYYKLLRTFSVVPPFIHYLSFDTCRLIRHKMMGTRL